MIGLFRERMTAHVEGVYGDTKLVLILTRADFGKKVCFIPSLLYVCASYQAYCMN
jgi:hypothetical protein